MPLDDERRTHVLNITIDHDTMPTGSDAVLGASIGAGRGATIRRRAADMRTF